MFSKSIAIAAIAATTAAASLPPTTVAPGSNSISPAEISRMKMEMSDLGVSESTQSRLIAQLTAGQLWDSMTSAAPIAESVMDTEQFSRTVYTNPDGSVTAVLSEVPSSAGVQTRSLPGCAERFSGGAKYASNCDVAYQGISFSYGFKVNYSYSNKLASMSVVAGSHHGHVVAGTWGFDGYTKTSRSVRGNFIITFGGLLAKTFKIQGNVNTRGAWVSRP